MFVFKKKQDESNKFDNTTVIVKSNSESLSDILADFKDFLMGCGYQIKPESELIFTSEEEDEESV